MATQFSEITDLALITIQDYKIDQLYQESQEDFNTYLAGFVVRAVPLFTNCYQSLDYDLATNTFANTLSIKEKNILANLVVQIWLERVQHNLRRLAATMTPSDAKRTSLPQLIDKSQFVIDVIREKVNQEMVDYDIKNFNFRKAGTGDFF